MTSGILLLDKPVGPTSHDAVARVRRAAGLRRVGHAGTLDPLADGLLVLGLGPAARFLEYLVGLDKTYETIVRLGQATTTYDAEGEVTAEHLTLPDEADVRAGVMASRVAAHVGEVALGRPAAVAREAAMNAARKALDWEAMHKAALDPQMLEKRREDHKTEEVCAMCGKFCSVKMLRDH